MGLFSFAGRLFFRQNNEDENIKVVFFGLGNPGEKYRYSRHNVGFRVIDSFNTTLSERRRVFFPNADFTRGISDSGIPVATVKPLTFMNRSGTAVAAVLNKWKTPRNRCLVVVDDFNLPLGTIRARRSGSDGGHNGLKSVIGRIGSDFPRLRIGIGPMTEKTDVLDFVLGNFSESEEGIVAGVVERASESLKIFAAEGIDAVMNMYN